MNVTSIPSIPIDGPPPNDIELAARALFEKSPIERHPLFVELTSGRLSIEEVRSLALQTYHVVDHFPRLLAAMLANLSDWRLRMPLAENLFEERGRMKPARVHVETYREFLRGLDIDDDVIRRSQPAIPVIAYNRALLDLCLHHPPEEGLGALAVVEEIVARVSPIVARAVPTRRAGSGEHFSDHEVLDLTHAEEIYAVASKAAESSGRRDLALRGMSLGWYYHRRFYTDLLALAREASG